MDILKSIPLLLVLFAGTVRADSYSVQIGTYRTPDRDALEERVPADLGELRSTTTPSGLTQFRVGDFASREDAEEALDTLRESGFDDAFVRRLGETQAHTESESTKPRDDSALLSSLSEEERRNVVYLDGRLHRKVGDEFIPLEDTSD